MISIIARMTQTINAIVKYLKLDFCLLFKLVNTCIPE